MGQHRTAFLLAAATCLATGLITAFLIAPASADPTCGSTVIFTTPSVTWSDVQRVKPPTLMSLTQKGAVGSISVHTDVSRPSYSSAFLTIGAGARMPRFDVPLAPVTAQRGHGLVRDVAVTSASKLRKLSVSNGYGARAGALAHAVDTPVVSIGSAASSTEASQFAQWSLLAAMDSSGHVDYAAPSDQVLQQAGPPTHARSDRAGIIKAVNAALSLGCATIVLDTGDLERAQAAGSRHTVDEALLSTDLVLKGVLPLLDLHRDLILVLSPTSPAGVTHLGVAVAVGPGFPGGSALESASTRYPGIVTLPDIAPTVLAHLHEPQPPRMNGQPFYSSAGNSKGVAAAATLDREAVFIDGAKPAMSRVFLIAELVLFTAAIALLWLRTDDRAAPGFLGRLVTIAALTVVGLPVATFLASLVPSAALGRGSFMVLCLLIDALVILLVCLLLTSPVERVGGVAALSLAVIVIDLVTGGHLQLNSVLGDSPLIAGRFAGAGNNAFAILSATAVVCGTLLVWRQGTTRIALIEVAVLFAVVIFVDGAPQFGSDLGGVLALVPGFVVAWMLLSGKRISLKLAAVAIVGAIAAVGVFVAVDLSRPPHERTHLSRFFEDVRTRGGSAFAETVRRKASSNLRQTRSLQNLYRFLPAAFVTALFLFWPLRWWRWFGKEEPVLRAGCIALAIVAVLGSVLNDSGITIFTTMLLFLAPMAILIRLSAGATTLRGSH